MITSAGKLPFRAIIHVAGLSMWWRSSEGALRDCVRNALGLASEEGFESIAFPLIGAGTGGMSADDVLAIMQGEIPQCEFSGLVRVVRFRSD